MPCREECEYARAGCEPLLNQFGFEWPEHLNCQKFPSNGICIDFPDPEPPEIEVITTAEPTTIAEPTTTTATDTTTELPPTTDSSEVPSEKEEIENNVIFQGNVTFKNCHCVCGP